MSLCINPNCSQPQNTDSILFCQKCGSQLLLGGQYRAVRILSKKGGFANTYEVTQQNIPKVLKVLKTDNIKAIELFEREFQVLSILDCQGIPQVYDLFLYYPRNSEQPLHCISMEKIEGIDLEEYIQVLGQPIDQKIAINWLSQLTQILQELHHIGIFHRDIKPSNIILQPDGQLVLIDFGAVKQAGVSQGQATRIYTPGYAAPEQERGDVNHQSDFFSLARTFVYLLTAKEPINLYAAYRDELVWRDQTKNISPEFLNLLDRLMQKEVIQRPDSTATIFREIAALAPSNTQSNYIFSQSVSPPGLPVTLTVIPKSTRSKHFSRLPFLLLGLGTIAAIIYLLKPTNSTETGQYFNTVKEVPSGQFRFGGSTTWATTRQSQSSVDAAIQGALPQFRLSYIDPDPIKIKSISEGKCPPKPGSNTGICMLIEGDLDFAQSSVSLDKSKYAQRVAQDRLQEIPVAYDALTIVVHPRSPISSLTIQNLRDIYTGTITNWNQLGGQDLPIKPFSRDLNAGGTVSSFQDLVMGKDAQINFDIVKTVNSPVAGLQSVKSNPGGIYYGSAKEMIVDFCDSKPLAIGTNNNFVTPYIQPLQSAADCRQGKRNKINTDNIKSQQYPLTRKIYVIFKADGLNSQKAGEAYAHLLTTNQGQDLLEKAGFVRIGK